MLALAHKLVEPAEARDDPAGGLIISSPSALGAGSLSRSLGGRSIRAGIQEARPPRPQLNHCLAARLLRPEAKLALILDADASCHLSLPTDVRCSSILETDDGQIIVRQPDPQICSDLAGQEVEVSAVHYDQASGQATRWGWLSKILGFDEAYCLGRDSRGEISVPAVRLSTPSRLALKRTNLRHDYRLDRNLHQGIVLNLPAAEGSFELVNFSAGGFLIRSNHFTPLYVGRKVPFRFIFPNTDDYAESFVLGLAQTVRLEYELSDGSARAALKFVKFRLDSGRAMEKIVSHYMLVEQKLRSRTDDGQPER